MKEKVILFNDDKKIVLASNDGVRHEYKRLAEIDDGYSKYQILKASILEGFDTKVFLVNDCGFYIPITDNDKVNHLLKVLDDTLTEDFDSIDEGDS